MKKDLLIICIAALVIFLVVSGADIKTPEEYYYTHLDDIAEGTPTVYLSIECGTVFNNRELLDPALKSDKYVPPDGIILPKTQYALRSGDAVYEILSRAVRFNKIQMETEYSFQFAGIYIISLNHLREFSCGALSGWVYLVNGNVESRGVNMCKLKDGDVIEFKFTCDLGRDI